MKSVANRHLLAHVVFLGANSLLGFGSPVLPSWIWEPAVILSSHPAPHSACARHESAEGLIPQPPGGTCNISHKVAAGE